jgi:ribosomal protection tetracycline resistance protein
VVVALAEGDDRVLDDWASDRPVSGAAALAALRRGLRTGALTPVLCGSATTGAGLPLLRDALVTLLPRPSPPPHEQAATVFAIDRDERGRRAWVRVWSGELRVRDRVAFGAAESARVTEVAVSTPDGLRPGVAGAGQIAVVRGPSARIGDTVGRPPSRRVHRFTPASLQALVEPVDPTRRTALYAGLAELADEDPLIDLRLDEVDGEAAVSLHGEVQKEVLAALLEERYGVAVRFLDTSTVCLERVLGVGASGDRIGTGGNPYLAGLALRVEMAPVGHGVEFSPGVERGNLPPAFVAATEEGVRAGLRQGPHGWEVTDCVVTMTASAYYPRQSRPHQKFDKSMSTVAADFRHLAPVVLAAALHEARTRVCRPIDRFELDLPAPAYPVVTALLGRLGASLLETSTDRGYTRLVGHLPSEVVPDVASRLPDLTGGEGVLVTALDHHAPVRGQPPRRRRRGPDPLDRAAWFRDVPR